jgi:hypothetical protein
MALSERGRSEQYRQRMRAAGLRPMQMWVPDIGRPDFARHLHCQLERLQGQPEEEESLDFIEAVQEKDTRH